MGWISGVTFLALKHLTVAVHKSYLWTFVCRFYRDKLLLMHLLVMLYGLNSRCSTL